MNSPLQRAAIVGVAVMSTALGASLAHAQSAWPIRPVRLVVPVAPGGGADIQARLFGKKLAESIGQSFVVDNRAGAGGVLGADNVAKSPADGYSILFATASLAVNASLSKKTDHDPVRELEAVSVVSSAPLVMSVHPSMPVRNVPEFVALARKRGDLNGASNGTGTTSHLALEMLRQVTGLKLTHIPFRGGVPATTSLVSGEVDFSFTTLLTIQPFVKQGKVRALAVTTPKRSSAMPEVPTMNTYYKDFEIDNWYAFFVPTGTPPAIVTRLHDEIIKALKSPDVIAYLTRDGGDPLGTSVEAANAQLKREVAKYAKIIAAGNVQSD